MPRMTPPPPLAQQMATIPCASKDTVVQPCCSHVPYPSWHTISTPASCPQCFWHQHQSKSDCAVERRKQRLCLTVVSFCIHLPLSTSFCVLVTIIVVSVLYWQLKDMLHKVSANISYWPHSSSLLTSSAVQYSALHLRTMCSIDPLLYISETMEYENIRAVNAVKAYSKYCTYISLWDWI